MFDKLFSGVISIAMMLFSSFEGNKPVFTEPEVLFKQNKLIIKTQLINAFENDFEKIFKSGNEVQVYFDLKLKYKDRVIFRKEYIHSVTFDPLHQDYSINLEERNARHSPSSYQKMLELVSKFELELDNRLPNEVDLTLEAYLKNLKLEIMDKECDLMLLWRYNRPKLKKTLYKTLYEN